MPSIKEFFSDDFYLAYTQNNTKVNNNQEREKNHNKFNPKCFAG